MATEAGFNVQNLAASLDYYIQIHAN